MIYLGNNEFIKGYINNLNKVYIGNDLLYWNIKEDDNGEIEKQYDLSLNLSIQKWIPKVEHEALF